MWSRQANKRGKYVLHHNGEDINQSKLETWDKTTREKNKEEKINTTAVPGWNGGAWTVQYAWHADTQDTRSQNRIERHFLRPDRQHPWRRGYFASDRETKNGKSPQSRITSRIIKKKRKRRKNHCVNNNNKNNKNLSRLHHFQSHELVLFPPTILNFNKTISRNDCIEIMHGISIQGNLSS